MDRGFDSAQLAALAAVVAEGTFEAAARRLSVTPSAVSQRIKALETAVGRVLVTRSKPVRATESGRAVVRLARQYDTLAADLAHELGDDGAASGDGASARSADGMPHDEGTDGSALPPRPVRMPIAVNADSLATWLLPALAPLAGRLALEFHREDQSHTTALLREGIVMAAITAEARPVQGCSSTPLGIMRYRPVASRGFVERWLDPAGPGLAHAPVVVFDRRDDLQDAFLRARAAAAEEGGGAAFDPPRHVVPASVDFAAAVALGYGWGMLPEAQIAAQAARVDDDPFTLVHPTWFVDVPLHWQQWQLRTPSLDLLAATVSSAAARSLRPFAQV